MPFDAKNCYCVILPTSISIGGREQRAGGKGILLCVLRDVLVSRAALTR